MLIAIYIIYQCLASYKTIMILAYFLGLFSSYQAFPEKPNFIPNEATSYIGIVDKEPRRPRVGEVIVSVSMLMAHDGELVDTGQRLLMSGIDLPWYNVSTLNKDDIIFFTGRYKKLDNQDGIFSYQGSLIRQGYVAKGKFHFVSLKLKNIAYLSQLRRSFILYIRNLLGEGESVGLFLSMAFGVRDVLSRETESAFRVTGLGHLLVVSGYQVCLLYAMMYYLGRVLIHTISRLLHFQLHFFIPHIFAFLSAIVFVIVIGLEDSVMRAILGLTIAIVLQITERSKSFLNSILVSLFLILLIWPLCFLEPGVQLTFAALLGIWCGSSRSVKFVNYIKICWSVWLCTSIVCILRFGEISLLGPLCNFALAPLSSIVSCNLGVVALVVNYLALDPNAYLLMLVVYLLSMIRDLVIYFSGFSCVALKTENIYLITGIAMLLIFFVWRLIRKENYRI
jgi:competence protein ComEC